MHVSFYVDPKDPAQEVRLTGKCSYPLSHLLGTLK